MASGKTPASGLVLFDIDGTLLRRAGPHHRMALIEAVRLVSGLGVAMDHIPVQGMLDRDIITLMMRHAGASIASIRRLMPEIVERAQSLYLQTCPDLRRKVCPGVRPLLARLNRTGFSTGLVTGNLSQIGWKKMENAGLRKYFRFGAFSEQGAHRAGLLRLALRQARREGWISRQSRVCLVGDHPNDILAAKANGARSIAVGTGLSSLGELASHQPDVLVEDLRQLNWEMLTG